MATPVEQLTEDHAYQLPREKVDVPGMVDRAQDRLPALRRQALKAALESGGWGREYPTLRTFPFREEYRAYALNDRKIDLFEPGTGAINTTSDQLSASELGRFFTPWRTWQFGGEFTQLRGLTYYTALDYSMDTPAKKLEVITRDIREGLDMVAGINRNDLGKSDYVLYLGILDHLKFHALTIFHALTFHERTGEAPDDSNYLYARLKAESMMLTFTRAYYQTCLGKPFDRRFSDTVKLKDSVGIASKYIGNSNHTVAHFTYPEATNPIIIMLGAHETARRKPYPDVIVGIPSGGTEIAVATGLMYEGLYPDLTPPNGAFIPLSFHYQRQGGIDVNRLAGIIRQSVDVTGKRVLIVDDNSNTGSTLQRMGDALIKAGARETKAHIAELDPARVMDKQMKFKGQHTFGVVNMDHPDLYTAMGLSGASDQDGGDLRLRIIRRLVRRLHNQQKSGCLGNLN